MGVLGKIVDTVWRPAHERESVTTLTEFLGLVGTSTSGENVTESTALGLSAVWRAVSLISGTIATLPLKTFRRLEDGGRERVDSFLDDPGRVIGLTPHVWTETVVAHLLLHGNAFLLHLRDRADDMVGLQPIRPQAVGIEEKSDVPGRRLYRVTLDSGETLALTSRELTHIMGFGTDGLRGLSPLVHMRNMIGTGIAADRAAARMFRNGLLQGGVLSTDAPLSSPQEAELHRAFSSKSGADKAGDVLLISRGMKFERWTSTPEAAQFLESRTFQVEEVARAFGVPKVLLAEDGASTWGSGIAELVRGMQRFTFALWTSRIEDALSRLVRNDRFVEFDFAGLLRPTETEATANIIAEVDAGILTPNEARQLKNRPPLSGGDEPQPTIRRRPAGGDD